MRRIAVLVVAMALAVIAPAVTRADTILGSSTGTLGLGGNSPDLGRAAARSSTWIEWGYRCDGFLGLCGSPIWNTGSVLQSEVTPFTVTGPADDAVLARLRWKNRETGAVVTDEWLDATWNLTFAVPGSETSPPIGMRINNTLNWAFPGSDWTKLAVGSLDGFSLTINGWIVDNFGYKVVSGSGGFDAASNVWWNPECGESYLALTADFTPVPEPTSMLLLGSGLVGLAGAARRRLRK